MKKIFLVMVAAFAVMNLSSCYVEVRGEHRYHHPFWHHREVGEIRGENSKVNSWNPASGTQNDFAVR